MTSSSNYFSEHFPICSHNHSRDARHGNAIRIKKRGRKSFFPGDEKRFNQFSVLTRSNRVVLQCDIKLMLQSVKKKQ